MRRAGFTLTELLVFSAIGSVLLGVTWGVLSSATRLSSSTEDKIQALEATLLVSARLQRDLGMLSETNLREVRTQVGIGGTKLVLPLAGATPTETSLVTYRYDALSERITRQVDEAPPRRLPGLFQAFLVRIVGTAGVEGPSVVYTLVGRAERGTDASTSEGAVRVRRSVLIGGAPREAAAGIVAYPAWNPVTY